MNKFKILFFTFSFCLIFSNQTRFDVRVGGFFPTYDLFRDIYGKQMLIWEIQSSTKIHQHFDIWANFDFLSKDGASVGFREYTKIEISNLSFGSNYTFKINEKMRGYLGLGLSPALLWLKNYSLTFKEKFFRIAYGAVGKSGVQIFFPDRVFLDFFVDYLFEMIHFDKWKQLGGVRVGGGIGLNF